MAKQCWSQTVLESGSWGHSVLQTPALVIYLLLLLSLLLLLLFNNTFCHLPSQEKEVIVKIKQKL